MSKKEAVQPTFVVDKDGLAKMLARKGKVFVVTELVSNAWDENTSQIDVVLERVEDDLWRLVVEDDNPEGFADLTHAYTLFAESQKKGDAEKRGRFNLGEKLVVAVCESASIATTKGTVMFSDDGRVMLPAKRKRGSVFTGTLRLTEDDVTEIEAVMGTLIPPPGIATTYNLTDLPEREPVAQFSATLRTELSDSEGRLRPTTRKCVVELYDPLDGEKATIYEMGIPVVDTGDRYHVNVLQKVPLSMDRDNVQPAYLRDVRAAVLNATAGVLTAEDANGAWVTDAISDPSVTADALKAVVHGRFGEKVVIADPVDREANKIAASEGYTVVPGGALPRSAWKQIREAEAILPAGQVTPSPNPAGGGPALDVMDPAHWPRDVKRVADLATTLADRLLGVTLEVRVVNAATWPFAATYTRQSKKAGCMTFNVGKLGWKWFGQTNGAGIVDLIVHELGHAIESDHLDRRYLNALTMLAGKATMLALTDPDVFRDVRPV